VTPLDDALTRVRATVTDCVAVGVVDLTAGLVLGMDSAAPIDPEVVELAAAATGDLFQGANVTAIETRLRGNTDDGALQEAILLSPPLVHLLQRLRGHPGLVLVTVASGAANIGLLLAQTRACLPVVAAVC
jgi:hypothetical protein